MSNHEETDQGPDESNTKEDGTSNEQQNEEARHNSSNAANNEIDIGKFDQRTIPASIFGYTILKLLTCSADTDFSNSFVKDFWRCLLVFLNDLNLITVLFQSVILIELWNSLSLDELVGICQLPLLLQIALYGVFLVLMCMKPVKNIAREIALASCEYFSPPKANATEKARYYKTNGTYFPVLFFVCLMIVFEFCLLMGVLIIGTKFLLGSTSVNELVKSSVAVAFIKDIDQFVYMGKFPQAYQSELQQYTFYSPKQQEGDSSLSAKIKMVKSVFTTYLGQYVLVVTSCGVVLVIRAKWCNESSEWY